MAVSELLGFGFFPVLDGVVNDADVYRVPGQTRADTHGPHTAAFGGLPLLHRRPVPDKGYPDLGSKPTRRTAETVG
jgi:hypothetical protein